MGEMSKVIRKHIVYEQISEELFERNYTIWEYAEMFEC
jgi:hypothetical protein